MQHMDNGQPENSGDNAMDDSKMQDMQSMMDMLSQMQDMMKEMMASGDMSKMPEMMDMMSQMNTMMEEMHGGVPEDKYMAMDNAGRDKADEQQILGGSR